MKRYMGAEFHQQESVWLSWPIEEFATETLETDLVTLEMLRHIPRNVSIFIICYDEEVKKRAEEKIAKNNLNRENLVCIEYPAEVIYPRDFGMDIVIENGEKKYVSHLFDGYGYFGLEDERSKSLIGLTPLQAKEHGIESSVSLPLVTEGGDHEFNGNGVLMMIEETEVDKRNPDLSKEEVEDLFKAAYGIKKIIWLPQGSYEDEDYLLGPIPDEKNEMKAFRSSSANGHIDEICRFVAEDTILMSHVTSEEASKSFLHHYNKERFDQARKVIKEATQISGEPFKVINMPVPEPIYIELTPSDIMYEYAYPYTGEYLDGTKAPEGNLTVLPALSYCNFLILNEVVLAQSYYQPGLPEKIKEKDEEALKILQSVFPDKKIIPINTLALNLFGGGIHCNTKNIPSYHINQ